MIHGLGERTRLQRIGKIRIGEKDSRGLPRSLDYFRIVLDDGFGQIEEAIRREYGEKPKRLTVYLPDEPTKDEVWSPWYRRYTASGLICKGDGLVGKEIGKDGQLVERPCADQGCPFAKPDDRGRVACKPTGILNLKVYGVDHPGTLQLTMRGWTQVDLAHSFLMGLKDSFGEATGVPFDLVAERVKGQKGVFTRIKFVRSDKPRVEAVEVDTEKANGVAVVDDTTGEVLGTPELDEKASTLAAIINEAVKDHILVGAAKRKALETLTRVPEMSPEEFDKTFNRMVDFITAIESTLDEPVRDHPEDEKLAKFAWEKLTPTDRKKLGIAVGSHLEMTRGQVRKAIAFLEGKKVAA